MQSKWSEKYYFLTDFDFSLPPVFCQDKDGWLTEITKTQFLLAWNVATSRKDLK